MSFRPVTAKAPASIEILEDTQLPFSAVILPYYRRQRNDDKKKEDSSQSNDKIDNHSEIIPAGSVAKCLNCGAFLNPYCHLFKHSRQFVCSLCDHQSYYSVEGQFEHVLQSVTPFEQEFYQRRYQKLNDSSAKSLYVVGSNDFQRRNTNLARFNTLTELNQQEIELTLPMNSLVDDMSKLSEEQQLSQFVDHLPAKDCPPLLICSVDVSSTEAELEACVRAIREAVHKAPTFVRFGLFLFSSRINDNDRISVFDLKSRYPHLKHCRLTDNFDGKHDKNQTLWGCLSESISLSQAFPLIGACLDTIDAALNVLPKCASTFSKSDGNLKNSAKKEYFTTHWPILGRVCESILTFLDESGGVHPGSSFVYNMSQDDTALNTNGHYTAPKNIFTYAGGKIMCFLSSNSKIQLLRNLKKEKTENDSIFFDYVGSGGFGGCCANKGNPSDGTSRYTCTHTSLTTSVGRNSDELDIESGTVKNKAQKSIDEFESGIFALAYNNGKDDHEADKIYKYYSEVGRQSAIQALGVEIFCVTTPNQHIANCQYFCVNLLRRLSERSGGCGPLLIDSSMIAGDGYGGSVECLVKEVTVRSPWYRPTAFCGFLRLRCSSSFGVEHEDNFHNDPIKSHKAKGMYGACSPFSSSMKDLWVIGACDSSSTISCDFEITDSNGLISNKESNDHTVPPCIQTAFAYTAVIPRFGDKYPCDLTQSSESAEEDCQWITVRKLKIFTAHWDIASNTESLTNSLNPETLSVVIYQKLLSVAMYNGLKEARILGSSWLTSVLRAAYVSAQIQYNKQQTQMRYAVQNDDNFYPNERLLDKGGELDNRSILLAGGHERLNALPLLMFALLQSDVFREVSEYFRPSNDARCAAACALSSIDPSSLSRCIAPRMEFWSNDVNALKPFEVDLNLERKSLEVINDEFKSSDSQGLPVVFVDSPRQILVYFYDNLGSSMDAQIGPELSSSIYEAIKSYRAPPPVHFACSDDLSVLADALVEDSQLNGMNFYEWCTYIADRVKQELNLTEGEN